MQTYHVNEICLELNGDEHKQFCYQIEKKESLKKAQHVKIENVAGSV
jgi:hypothetical protein